MDLNVYYKFKLLIHQKLEGSCEHGDELSGSLKCWEVPECLQNWQLLRKGSAPQVSIIVIIIIIGGGSSSSSSSNSNIIIISSSSSSSSRRRRPVIILF
jgi:hypothetical protein